MALFTFASRFSPLLWSRGDPVYVCLLKSWPPDQLCSECCSQEHCNHADCFRFGMGSHLPPVKHGSYSHLPCFAQMCLLSLIGALGNEMHVLLIDPSACRSLGKGFLACHNSQVSDLPQAAPHRDLLQDNVEHALAREREREFH